MALTVGDRIAHYDVTALIGEGGMGQVYSKSSSRSNRAKLIRLSRSMATSGRARGAPNLSAYVSPCSARISRALWHSSQLSHARLSSRTWCGSRSHTETTCVNQARVAARRWRGALGSLVRGGHDLRIRVQRGGPSCALTAPGVSRLAPLKNLPTPRVGTGTRRIEKYPSRHNTPARQSCQ